MGDLANQSRSAGPMAMVMAGLLLSGAGEAVAQSRTPAPIVYAGPNGVSQHESPPAEQSPRQVAHQTAPALEDRATARIAFVYPTVPASKPVATTPGERVAAEPVKMASVTPVVEPATQPRIPTARPEPVQADYQPVPAPLQPVAGPAFDQVGLASWYGEAFHGRPTANGETFDMDAMSAAHPSLPLPSLVQVVNLENNQEVVVRVNDRGPFTEGRILDLSKGAAKALGFLEQGETRVRLRYLGPAPVGSGMGLESLTQTREVASEVIDGPAPVYQAADPSPVADPVAAAPSGDAFFVQLGAFSSIANAERLKLTLSANLPVAVQPVRVNGADFFRVLVGPWNNQAKAQSVQSQLAARDLGQGMVVTNP
ncbi:MAG: septal ring lytic transglycosylase RlpA family protein [Pseudomonadota bacterium]